MAPERLSFFSELDGPDFLSLVDSTSTRPTLQALAAHVTMGLRDFSSARAEAVRRLTDDGIPVGAWLLLEPAHGYFATHDNADAVRARVDAFEAWATRHQLRFTSLGFDFEPDLAELQALFRSPWRTLGHWARRASDHSRRARAVERYGALLARLAHDGWRVESYQFPLLLQDRAAGSHFFQRFASALDVPVQREVMMAYSSLLGPFGAGLVDLVSGQCTAVAVGSTGGGVDPLPSLTFEELSRDLRLAARACRDVSVFSLEGCVAQGFLPRLINFDWEAPVSLALRQRAGAAVVSGMSRGLTQLFR